MAYTTLLPGRGYFYTAPEGTEPPTDALEPGVAWKSVGNTPISDILTFNSEGGEETIIPTLQNARHRVNRSDLIESLGLALHDFTEDSYELYYGTNSDDTTYDGWIGPNVESASVWTGSFLAVLIDGDSHFPMYVPKCEIYRAEGISLAGTEELAALPIRVTPLTSAPGVQPYYVKPLIDNTTGLPVGVEPPVGG